ncbi:TlpA family protein disulfide reductase [Arenibacter sp. 6A1]|uniref:TlpA disulfide reductase family protein n=1 Tax=Arenibacter sp. 6A1 TaxID=2720391 RepID=UPI00144699C4|nr:TlpA disulfide reductase family protein [Arenibacter sp. 6A1]NKI24938.1 TlpA family protein disulfide reductase [Arenibacter sp. 6A1]
MNMFKIIIILTFNFSIALAQYGDKTISVNGKISYERKSNDSIYFSNFFAIDQSYFEQPIISSRIENGTFKLETGLPYPHMYVISYKSEKDIYPQRDGTYFIDPSTTSIMVDSVGDSSKVDGVTHQEYKNRFVPFFIDEGYKCDYSLLDCRFMGKGSKFDTILSKYVKKYPESYVALWFLIERMEMEGHHEQYEETLQLFLPRMKKEKLWQMAHESLNSITIRKDRIFPELDLKTVDLDLMTMILPKAKYTLVDFWFSRCKPCLEAFPKIKELYGRFRDRGFEIVSISVDKVEYIPKWQERIVERELNWPQYLDENGGIAEKNKIVSYPTTFLLDEKGIVIEKNLPLEDLERLLENNLAP